MMKQILITVIAVLLGFSADAQYRRLSGGKSVEALYGISASGQTALVSFVSYKKSNLYFKTSAFYDAGEVDNISYQSYGMDFGPAFALKGINETVYFNVVGGITASFDHLTPPISVFDENGSVSEEDYGTFKYGVFIGGEIEIFVVDKVSVVLSATQRFLFAEDFGATRYFLLGGLRYNF